MRPDIGFGQIPASSLVKLEHPVSCEREARPYPHGPLGAKVQQSHPKRRLVEQRLGLWERFLLARGGERRGYFEGWFWTGICSHLRVIATVSSQLC